MPNYQFVIDSSFRPFEMNEILQPYLMYKDAYEQAEAGYNELSDKAGEFEYLSKKAPAGSKAREIYEGYANDLRSQARDLSKYGLSMGNRRALTNLKRRYSGEIGRLAKANERMEEERKLRQANGDTSMLYATNALNLDEWLDNETPNLYKISGNELRQRGKEAALAASSRVYNFGDEGSTLGGYFRKWGSEKGYSAESMREFAARLSAIPELQQQVDRILDEKKVRENLSDADIASARLSVINGMIDGAIYEKNVNPVRDPGVPSWTDKDNSARSWAQFNESVRQHNQQMAMQRQQMAIQKEQAAWSRKNTINSLVAQGYVFDKNGNIDYDATRKRQRKVAIEDALISNIGKGNGIGGTAKTAEEKSVENFKKNGWKGTDGSFLFTDSNGKQSIKKYSYGKNKFKPFYGEAFGSGNFGFDIEEQPEIDASEMKKINYKFLSNNAKTQLRDYVRKTLPNITRGFRDNEIDQVIEYMDLGKNDRFMRDDQYVLKIPGYDWNGVPEGNGDISGKSMFEDFMTKVNQIRKGKVEATNKKPVDPADLDYGYWNKNVKVTNWKDRNK